ncbi:MAG: hypothetical protein DRP87_06940 [Spirochaetes bacterium]|nr:MAG: hypothetical protein DRP87_06940 [Spirochaetota bacterium]
MYGYIVFSEYVETTCPYFDRNSTIEHFIVDQLSVDDLDFLLERGYRHFGRYVFRPVCGDCHSCIPLRIPLAGFTFPRSARRLFNRASHFRIELTEPIPSKETYALYSIHKKRFKDSPPDTYMDYLETFFTPLPGNYQLSIYDNNRLIAVSHIDITERALSAVYCYYDDSYRRESPGTLSIFKEIEIAIERRLRFVYLGYYIRENSHMSYKSRFKPNQILLEEGKWVDFMDRQGNIKNLDLVYRGFTPKENIFNKRFDKYQI